MIRKLLLIIFFAMFIAGCGQLDFEKIDLSNVSEGDINKVIVCEKPYMRFEAGCCLD